jgi:serine/threonine protein kinase
MIDARLKGDLPPEFGATLFSKVIFGVAAIMARIHSCHVIHRDLKPESIFLVEKYEPLISHFNLSRFHSDSSKLTHGVLGSPLFMAPELLYDDEVRVTNKMDVFSYGCLIYRIFTQKIEFSSGVPRSTHTFLRRVLTGERMIRVPGIPDKLWELIINCWSQDATQRPSFEEITGMMLESFDFVLGGTNLHEYREYQQRIILQLSVSSMVDNSDILKSLRGLGIDIDSMRGIRV